MPAPNVEMPVHAATEVAAEVAADITAKVAPAVAADVTADVATEARLVLTTLPDRDAALAMARTLVEERLAACVSLLGEATSVYRWQGAVETAPEVPLLIKTTSTAWPELCARIAALHPYEVPEIIALPVTDGLPAYLAWIGSSTTSA